MDLPAELWDKIREMNWMQCFTCNTQILEERSGVIYNRSFKYSIVQGRMLCSKCKP